MKKLLIIPMLFTFAHAQKISSKADSIKKGKRILENPVAVELGVSQSSNVDSLFVDDDRARDIFKLNLSYNQKKRLPKKSVIKFNTKLGLEYDRIENDAKKMNANFNTYYIKRLHKKLKAGLKFNVKYLDAKKLDYNYTSGKNEFRTNRSLDYSIIADGKFNFTKTEYINFSVGGLLSNHFDPNFFYTSETDDSLSAQYYVEPTKKFSNNLIVSIPGSYQKTFFKNKAALSSTSLTNTTTYTPATLEKLQYGPRVEMKNKKLQVKARVSGVNQNDLKYGAETYKSIKSDFSARVFLPKGQFIAGGYGFENRDYENSRVYDNEFNLNSQLLDKKIVSSSVTYGKSDFIKKDLDAKLELSQNISKSNRFNEKYKNQKIEVFFNFKI